MDPTGVIIDGGLPRHPAARVLMLTTYISNLLNELLNISDLTGFSAIPKPPPGVSREQVESAVERLRQTTDKLRVTGVGKADYAEHEDMLLEVIGALLGERYIVTLGEPDPGDVVVSRRESAAD